MEAAIAHAENLRPVEALLEEIRAEGHTENELCRGLEAFLAALMEREVRRRQALLSVRETQIGRRT